MDKNLISKSKYVSYKLRHDPSVLDKNGWADVNDLLKTFKGSVFTHLELEELVLNNDKQRFEFNDDRTKIRARQGHSVQVDVEFKKEIPPAELYHGTKEEFLPSIKKLGLIKGNRNHVHLSADKNTALIVANRRKGKSVILTIDAMHMRAKNYKFFLSNNGVWLTDNVPAEFIEFPTNSITSPKK